MALFIVSPLCYQVFRLKMAGLGVYKLDNGECFPTNCFPIRSFHQSKEGKGIGTILLGYAVSYKYKQYCCKCKNMGPHYILQCLQDCLVLKERSEMPISS